jgi:hypothetical protein
MEFINQLNQFNPFKQKTDEEKQAELQQQQQSPPQEGFFSKLSQMSPFKGGKKRKPTKKRKPIKKKTKRKS